MAERETVGRRDVLRFGTLGLAGLSTGGCALANANLSAMASDEDIDLYVREMTEQLNRIDGAELVTGFAKDFVGGSVASDKQPQLADADQKVRRILRTLVLSQTFRELPPETQRAPKVQALMKTHMPAISDTVFEVTHDLESLTTTDRSALQKFLRERPDLPNAIGATLDRHAYAAGLSMKTRLKLRGAMLQTSHRLKNEDPSVLINEYTAKVRQASAPGRAEAFAIAGADAYGRKLIEHAKMGEADGSRLPDVPASGMPGLKVGGFVVGLAVTAALSGVILEVAGVKGALVVLGATVGGILFAIGLITLIVSGIVYAVTS